MNLADFSVGRAYQWIGHALGFLTIGVALFWSGIICPLGAAAMNCGFELLACMLSGPAGLLFAAAQFWVCGWLLTNERNRTVPLYRNLLLAVPIVVSVGIFTTAISVMQSGQTICRPGQ
jgi:hypothetical protein